MNIVDPFAELKISSDQLCAIDVTIPICLSSTVALRSILKDRAFFADGWNQLAVPRDYLYNWPFNRAGPRILTQSELNVKSLYILGVH